MIVTKPISTNSNAYITPTRMFCCVYAGALGANAKHNHNIFP